MLGAASMVTPQGAAKKAVAEGAELAVEQLGKHADTLSTSPKPPPPHPPNSPMRSQLPAPQNPQ
ncbi:hypothetical protein LI99_22790 [Mycolicibacterium smegmatis]|uniref:Uncharacterized protein n=1 Tax=Mycolicibacterium smegmatis (strain ATCC 700084 / mc(2)155) TaxID=246196 RepID=A0R137_MYCS2|nr:hypothetical protein MSMEG_4608 [Mycolicibacterium smegmatis MC2 155]AIU16296.1 hypothetical protein LI99_22790 [Mycolicibacterium smegmatis]AIU09671.1 hypothetical protein LJ00_22785 [Mycolicibacterium smegmatis MC2 155]AIU22919.1 hypothetical protein LI98_22795 [Mycolicibacterium smegmatis]TBH50709.1 hypothetical protein EYS45_04835 [Mycolicibacterium smegmatis MC2 155]